MYIIIKRRAGNLQDRGPDRDDEPGFGFEVSKLRSIAAKSGHDQDQKVPGGLRASLKKSTRPDAIDFKVVRGTNIVTLTPELWENETRIVHRVPPCSGVNRTMDIFQADFSHHTGSGFGRHEVLTCGRGL